MTDGGRPSGYLPRIGVRGRLFAGNCSVLMRWMCLLQLTRGSTWTGDSASRPYLHTRGSTWTGDSASRPYLHTRGSTWTGDSASRPYLHTRGSTWTGDSASRPYLHTRGSTWTGDSASRPYLHTRGSTWTGDSASRPYLHTTRVQRGRATQPPLPTYDGVPVSSSLSRYFRRYDGWVEGEGGKEGPPSQSSPQMGEEARRGWGNRSGGDGFPPRIGVRGRLFAGNCSVLMRWMCLLQLTRGSTWTGDSASRPYLHDSRLNVDGRLSESPLPTYDGVQRGRGTQRV